MKNVIPIRGPKKDERYSIIIPSAGIGRRMGSYGPKSLIKIGNTNIINYQLKLLRGCFRNAEIILVTGFCAQKLMNNTPSDLIKIENEKYEQTNVARSIGIGLRACTTENVLIIYGDLIFNQATLNAPLYKSCILYSDQYMPNEDVGCIIREDEKTHQVLVQNMFYDLPNKWSQIMFVVGNELKLLKKITWNPDNYRLYGFEVINLMLEQGAQIAPIKPKNSKVIDIDSSSHIEIAKEIVYEHCNIT